MFAHPTAVAGTSRFHRTLGRLMIVALTVLIAFALPTPAHTAEPVAAATGAADVSDKALADLVQTIEDDQARQKLLDQLRALQAARRSVAPTTTESPPLGVFDGVAGSIERLGRQLVAAAGVLFDIPEGIAWLQGQFADPDKRSLWIEIILKLFLVLVVGVAAEKITRRLLARPRGAVEDRTTDKTGVRAALLALRTLLDILPLLAFGATAYAVLAVSETSAVTRGIALAAINANILARAVTAGARMVLAPRVAALRLPPVGDETANYVFVWLRRFTVLAVYGYFAAIAAQILAASDDGFAIILKLVGLVLAAMLIVFVLQNRGAVAGAIRGDAGPEAAGGRGLRILRARLADIWHILAIVYIAGVYLVTILETEGGVHYLFRATVLTLVILAATWLLAAALKRTVAHGFALGDETKARFPLLETRANRYLPVLQAILRGIIYVLALLSLMEAWGIDAYGWLATEPGARALHAVATILFVILLAVLTWEIASSAIERQLKRLGQSENSAGRARLATLLPLIRQMLFFALAAIVTMIVLSELGVNIGPLIAAAGVVGLAIGFGAQTLVKDVITGMFILLENQIRVGDVVNLGGNGGIVEGMTIRTIRLRDLSGTVHIIPFSEVGKVLNLTKEFSYYLLEIGVAYREDTDQVVEVCREILDEMRDDSTYGPSILEPLDVLGVDRFDESAVIVRARIKTRPIKQWQVGREFNRRMKKKFDELGIEIPFPHRTIYFGVDKDGLAPPAPVELRQGGGGDEKS